MADSCRPVSRHGRYSATGPSSVAYGTDVAPYGNVDYTPSNEMYTVNQPERSERPERPKTGRGRRRARTGDMPPRPSSRRSNQFQPQTGQDVDHESYGRPASRVGFSPEADYRYSHDEFSRQISNEKRVVNSPSSSPDVEDIYQANQAQAQYSPTLHTSPSPGGGANVDRLIVSPSNPQNDMLGKSGVRQSPHRYTTYSPQNKRQSPQYDGYSQYVKPLSRPSSRDYINVSPIQRDEVQLTTDDIHHETQSQYPYDRDPYAHEGEAYAQSFSESPQYRNSPYRESPQYRNSPYRDSPQQRDQYAMGSSPTNKYSYGSSPSYTRPPPSQRPKSARPKTGRKKSARARHRHEEQETSQPQMCNPESILHTGDPYGRPSSSLSRYKPLPAIGMTTPRRGVYDDMDNITSHTDSMVLDNRHDLTQYHPADDNIDSVCVEDIQGHRSDPTDGPLTDQGIPDVSVLTNLPQHLSSEIFSNSLANYEQNVAAHGDNGDLSQNNDQDINLYSSKINEPLDFLHELPDEPSENETRLLLAVKLPDGKRIQRYFSPQDQLKAVLDFAENDSLLKYRDYHLVCNAPRTTFVDVLQRIEDTGLRDRTVLYLEDKDV